VPIIIVDNNYAFIIIFCVYLCHPLALISRSVYLCHPLTLVGRRIRARRRRRSIGGRGVDRRKVGVVIEGEIAALVNNDIADIV
jgi:hypothetical protein